MLQKRRKSKNLFLIFLTLIFIGVSLFAYTKTRYEYFINTPVNPGEITDISFTIKKGENVGSIGKKLFEKNLVIDTTAFEWYNRLNGSDRKILSGRFILNRDMTIPEIVERISDKNKSQVVLTIPEGSTIVKIDQKLVDQDLIKPGDFVEATKRFTHYDKYPFLDFKKNQELPYPLEGFLFPDTYFLNATNFNTDELIELMLNNFEKRVSEKFNADKIHTGKTLFEIITMASIIEQEVNTDKDRPIISGLLWKRLKEDWQLGTDATLLYLKEERSIDLTDLLGNSAYNTRKFKGLPPGPIGNPGIKSIDAALNPEESQYYFYLNRPDTGEVVYAKTNDEHNANKEKYLR